MDFTIAYDTKLSDQVFDARFHPKKDLVAAASIDGSVSLIQSGNVIKVIDKHHKGSSVRKVRFCPDGRMVTIAKTAKVHDIEVNKTIHTLKRHFGGKSALYSVKPIRDDLICAGDDEGCLFVWDLRTPNQPIFSASDCDQYISDIDDRYEVKKQIACTSGEGTLTAYDMRNLKMIEPQSELFEAGFQCLRLTRNKKVVVGGEDGAVYVFNQGEWAHTSGKFAISDDSRNRGKCSIDAIEILPTNDSVFLAACSDGYVRSFTLWPHSILSQKILCHRSPLESMHFNEKSQIVVTGDQYVQVVNCEEKEQDDATEETPENDEKLVDSDSDGREHDNSGDSHEKSNSMRTNAKIEADITNESSKRLKVDTEDYLSIFK